MDKKKIKAPSFIQALVILLVVVAILMLSVTLLDVSIQIALLFSIIIASCFAIFLGYKWDDVQKMMMDGVMSMLIATFILMLIGAVIATWIASGTIPYIIYLGLKLISPKFFYSVHAWQQHLCPWRAAVPGHLQVQWVSHLWVSVQAWESIRP